MLRPISKAAKFTLFNNKNNRQKAQHALLTNALFLSPSALSVRGAHVRVSPAPELRGRLREAFKNTHVQPDLGRKQLSRQRVTRCHGRGGCLYIIPL